jgi:hypothetical protein
MEVGQHHIEVIIGGEVLGGEDTGEILLQTWWSFITDFVTSFKEDRGEFLCGFSGQE